MNKVSKEQLCELYISQLLPMHEVARRMDIAIGTVYNYLKKYNIPTRKKEDVFTMKGRRLNDEQREAISQRTRGRVATAETRAKMSVAKKLHGKGHKKRRADGYICVYYPDHERSSKDGYIMEHILVIEEKIGRHLNENECVHHINRKKDDNRIENLMLLTKSEHMSLHSKERWAKIKGGMTY